MIKSSIRFKSWKLKRLKIDKNAYTFLSINRNSNLMNGLDQTWIRISIMKHCCAYLLETKNDAKRSFNLCYPFVSNQTFACCFVTTLMTSRKLKSLPPMYVAKHVDFGPTRCWHLHHIATNSFLMTIHHPLHAKAKK